MEEIVARLVGEWGGKSQALNRCESFFYLRRVLSLTALLGLAEKVPQSATQNPKVRDTKVKRINSIMKIVEAQSATLTNFEVYSHLLDQRARYKARNRKGKTVSLPRHNVVILTASRSWKSGDSGKGGVNLKSRYRTSTY